MSNNERLKLPKRQVRVEQQRMGGIELLDAADLAELEKGQDETGDDVLADEFFRPDPAPTAGERPAQRERRSVSLNQYVRRAWSYFKYVAARLVEDPALTQERARQLAEREYLFNTVDQAFSKDEAEQQPALQEMIGHTVTLHRVPYTLIEYVAKGAFGLVFRASSPDGRTVIIKLTNRFVSDDMNRPVPDQADPESVHNVAMARSTIVEAATLHRLRRAAVETKLYPQYYGATQFRKPGWKPGEPDERIAAVAMEEIAGPSLAEIIEERGNLADDPAEIIQIASGLLQGIQRMHAAGLLHLDLKPKNTAIRNHRPVLLDFGAAMIQEEFSQRAHWARPEVITTTPGYVTEAEKVLATPQRDVYALGITLRDMIYGRSSLLELDDELYRDYCQQRYRDLPPQLQALSNIVDRMTEVDPEKRWALQQVADAFAPIAQPQQDTAKIAS